MMKRINSLVIPDTFGLADSTLWMDRAWIDGQSACATVDPEPFDMNVFEFLIG